VSGDRGQASVEVAGAAVALMVGGLAVFQLLAAGRAATVADGAAEAAAIALVNGRDPAAAARAAAPGWPRERVHVQARGGRVSVTLDSPAALHGLPAPLHVTASAVVRRPRE
jgi:hypothetical protein